MSPALVEILQPVDVVGLPIRPFDLHGLVEAIVARAQQRITTLGCYSNAHTVNLACSDPEYGRVLRKCDLLYADGASIAWAGRLAGISIPGRITAMDYFPVLASRCAQEGLSMFLLGSKPGIIDTAAQNLRAEFPNLRIAGFHHGHFDLTDSSRILAEINAAQADILAVGMSSPRQEFWLREHRETIQAPVRWCVGALFDYLGGGERRAPAWLCRMGGEWLFRLAMDPSGKWRRYLLGNPRFLWNTLRWLLVRRQGLGAAPNLESMGGLHE